MFKPAKFDGLKDVSALSQAKSSARRALRKKLQEEYPGMDEALENMFPKKGNVAVAKCPGRVELIALDLVPAFFSVDGTDQHAPTLRLLHQFPEMLPRMVVDEGATVHIMSGANVFCAGFTARGGFIPEGLEEGVIVAVCVHGKEHAVAVGRTTKSGADIRRINKGVAVQTLHYLADGLWPITKLS